MSPLWRPLRLPSRPRVRLHFQCLLPEPPRFRFLCPRQLRLRLPHQRRLPLQLQRRLRLQLQRRLRLLWIPPSPRSPLPHPLRPRSPRQLQLRLQRPRQLPSRRRALPLPRSPRQFHLQLLLPNQPLLLRPQALQLPRSPRHLPPQLQLQLQLLNQRLRPLRPLPLLPSDCSGGWAITLSRRIHRQRQDLAGTLS